MKTVATFIIVPFLFLTGQVLHSDENLSYQVWQHAIKESPDAEWRAKLRARTLTRLDKMLSWAFPYKERSYSLHEEQEGVYFINEVEAFRDFAQIFGYFSKKHPIVSRVTPDKEDIDATCKLLKIAHESCKDEAFLEMATSEILTKILAYRQLEKGTIVSIPVVTEHGSELIEFAVEDVFTLWLGMPAFGLVPKGRNDIAPILLFRGTDLSLESKQGWASVLSDLDITGPGLTAFQKSKEDIEHWLKNCSEKGAKAVVMGHSLGGVLAIYTMIYEYPWVNEKGSMAFNPPGVSPSVYKDWQNIPKGERPDFTIYVTKGDFIPKIGNMVATIYELSLEQDLSPIDAHVRLMTCQNHLYRFSVNRHRENQKRS